MHASEIMTRKVITVRPTTTVSSVVELMIRHRISGLPVIDDAQRVIGIVSEGDLLHRIENGTEQRATPWLQRLFLPRTNPEDFIKSHGRHVHEIMTPRPVTVDENMPLSRIAQLLDKHHIRRVPVTREERLCGIITRANLLRGFALHPNSAPATETSDSRIREIIVHALRERFGISELSSNVVVSAGEVELWGLAETGRQAQAAGILASEVPGVTVVRNHLHALSHELNPA